MKEKIKIADRIAHDMASSIGGLKLFLHNFAQGNAIDGFEALREKLRYAAKTVSSDAEIIAVVSGIIDGMKKEASLIEEIVNSVEATDEEMTTRKKMSAQSVEKIKAMIDDLSKLNSKEDFSPEKFVIEQIIKRTINELRYLMSEKNVSLDYSAGTEVVAHIDERALNRIIVNMIVNASQAMDEGEILVCLHGHDDIARIEVIDNGKGIFNWNIPKIFNHGFTFGKKDGTGVGLAYCKDVIERHGGNVAVHSRSKQGTIFAINLPRLADNPSFRDQDSMELE